MLGFVLLILACLGLVRYLKEPIFTPTLVYNIELILPYVIIFSVLVILNWALIWSFVNARENEWRRAREDGEYFPKLAQRQIQELRVKLKQSEKTNEDLWSRLDAQYGLKGMMEAGSVIQGELWHQIKKQSNEHKRIKDARERG